MVVGGEALWWRWVGRGLYKVWCTVDLLGARGTTSCRRLHGLFKHAGSPLGENREPAKEDLLGAGGFAERRSRCANCLILQLARGSCTLAKW